LARVVPLASPLLDPRSRSTVNARIAAASAGKRQAYAQIERAKAALTFARRDVERLRALAKAGSIADAQLERSELELRTLGVELTSTEFAAKVADYELQMAEAARGRLTSGKTYDELTIPSPITGKVLRVLRESEGAVQPGTPLLEIGDPKALEIAVDVLTSDAVRIAPGANVYLERWGGAPLKGVVRRIEPSAFTKLWVALGDGYRVEAKIVVWRAENVLKLPASATFRHGGGWAVYARRGNVARLVPVELGHSSGLEIELHRGLHAGEQVIVHPSDRLVDGISVTAL
jgi:HlyD family secretion protein